MEILDWGDSDHPRSRGVYSGTVIAEGDGSGSSPLARGLLEPGDVGDVAPRIIPARAGFTGPGAGGRRRRTDHPRSRGVYQYGRQHHEMGDGSSPLARGLRQVEVDRVRGQGIIPARAGFTEGRSIRRARSWDHPRSRGVYNPPMDSASIRPWIIPARAGFTLPRALMVVTKADHPRSRGVYSRTSASVSSLAGSSPLARGLQTVEQVTDDGEGIIPARAGFTYRGSYTIW